MRLKKGFTFEERKTQRGFTLIELLVVISIIGMLTALIVVNFNAARARARDVQRKSDLDQIKKALRMYYNDYDIYPAVDGSGDILACGPGGNAATACSWGGKWSAGSANMVYMKILPQDPISGQIYSYLQAAAGQDFLLSATLENKSDGDICDSQVHCEVIADLSDCDQALGQYVTCAD